MFACVCVHVCMCGELLVHVLWRQRLVLRIMTTLPPPSVTHLANQLALGILIPLPRLGLQTGHHACLAFCVSSGDPDSGPRA